MRTFNVAVLVTVAAIFRSSGVAVAAPKDYCADLEVHRLLPGVVT